MKFCVNYLLKRQFANNKPFFLIFFSLRNAINLFLLSLSYNDYRNLCYTTELQIRLSHSPGGVVGCGRSVMYLMSLGLQLILAYSWARPAILVAGKGRGGCFYFFCFFTFILVFFLPCPSLSSSLLSLFSFSLGDDTK